MGQIKWLGHAGFEIIEESGLKIFIDPFQIQTNDRANVILITHEHYDHLSREDLKKIETKDTIILVPPDCQSKLRDFPGKVMLVEPGREYTAAGLTIRTVNAYNTNKHFHPQGNEWIGYILESEGKKIYHAGDTDFIPEMKSLAALNIDVALLPVSGTYVMTAQEAANAALAIRPKLAIPMHWGSIVGTQKDAEKFKEMLDGKINVHVPVKSS